MKRWCKLIRAVEQAGINLKLYNKSKNPAVMGDYNYQKKRIRLFPEGVEHDMLVYTLLHELTHHYTTPTVMNIYVPDNMVKSLELCVAISEYVCNFNMCIVADIIGIKLNEEELAHNKYRIDEWGIKLKDVLNRNISVC